MRLGASHRFGRIVPTPCPWQLGVIPVFALFVHLGREQKGNISRRNVSFD